MKPKIDLEHRMDDTKLLWHMNRVMEHFDKGERIAPIHIDMGIAKKCNMACVYCYGKYQTFTGEIIEEEPLIQTMKDAKEIGIKSIGLIGDGEPTCNPYMYEALDFATCDMALSTNGVLLNTDEKLETILKNCVWMRFNISAGTREGYHQIHKIDRFDDVVENVERMVEIKKAKGYKCEIGLQAVFVPTLMAEEMVKESEMAVRLGVDYFVIKQCSLPDKGETGMMQFNLDDYENPEIIDALKTCENLSTEDTEIIVKWNLIMQKGKRLYNGCPSIPLLLEISGNGDVYPCGHMFGNKPQFDKYKMGNLHDISLKDIINSDKYWDIIKDMRYNFDVHSQCKGACRQDKTNEFVYNYLNSPRGINFI